MINVDIAYAHRPDQIQFVAGIFELVAAATRLGYKIIVITNQAGIGRGYYTEHEFAVLMNWISDRFAEADGKIDAVYFCPHHPEHGIGAYRQQCTCRKPAPGMLLQAVREHDIDPARSIFVGDKKSDMEAGRSAGIGTLLYVGDEADYAPGHKLASPSDAIPHLHGRA